MSSVKEVRAFVADVTSQDGWEWESEGRGRFKVSNPAGSHITITTTPTDPRWRENETKRLRAELGYDPEAAKEAKKRRSAERLQQDRERAAAQMERAERDAEIRQRMAEESARAAQEGSFGEIEVGDGVLKGWPTVYRYITVEEAFGELERYEHTCCPRRGLHEDNIRNWVQILETGAFRLTGSPIVYTNCNNKCLGNGQHRFHAMQRADRKKLDARYPNGVPYLVISEFPPELIHTLDSGKNRTFKNLLELAGKETQAGPTASAIRLAIAYDRTVRGEGLPWSQWNKLLITNTEFEIAQQGDYASMGEWARAAGRLWTRTRMNKTAGMVLHFLLDRDAEDQEKVEEFFDGVSGNAVTGDPRRELAQFTFLAAAGKRKKASHPAAQQLGMAVYAFDRWMIDPNWRVKDLRFGTDQKIWPVYRSDMEIIKGELRKRFAPASTPTGVPRGGAWRVEQ